MITTKESVDVGQLSDRPIGANEARIWMREIHRLGRLIESYLDRPDPPDADTDRMHIVDEAPPLALRCDGRVMLNLGELRDVDLSKHELWTGIVLPETSACDAIDYLADGFQGAAGLIGGEIMKRARVKREGEEA